MADSLNLVGVRDVRKHAGTEMQLLIPRRGGHTHQVREWWRPKGVNTTYATCSIFRVTTADGSVRLALNTGKFEGSEIRIMHDGSFNFTFSNINELDRAALYTDDMQLIEHYIFPTISGGKIATVTPPGAAARPNAGPPPTEIDEVTVSGEENPTVGSSYTYRAVASGTTSDFTYTWGVGFGGTIDSGDGTDEATITWNAIRVSAVTCVVGSTDETWNNVTQEDTLTVNIGAAATSIGTVNVTGNASPDDGATGVVYSAARTGDAGNLGYAWSVDNSGTAAGPTNESTFSVDWSGTTASTVTCVVTSTDAAITDSPQTGALSVTPVTPPPATGPADSVTLVTTATTQGAGSIAATTTTSANGNGLTVTYDSDGTDASNLAIAEAGDGYQDGDTFSVDGDTVTGTVSIASVLTANNAVADVSHVVTQAGGYYYIDGVQQAEVTATAGDTIYFDLSDASLSGHPFKIYTDATKTTEVTVGIASDANGLIFTPPISGSFSYQCASHAGMGGDITISQQLTIGGL